jgi:hypothetical protein
MKNLMRRGGRVAEGNGLLNRRRSKAYRGFKSRPLRHIFPLIFPIRSPLSHWNFSLFPWPILFGITVIYLPRFSPS